MSRPAVHRLYYSPDSCSLAPHIVLEEIGAPYEEELVLARNGAMTDTDEWRAVNPKGRVPALTGVPGSVGGAPDLLTEAPAILLFLARSHPEAGLLPDEPVHLARAVEWLNWLSGAIHAQSFGQVWRPQRFVDDEALFPAVREKGLANLRTQFSYVDALLGDGRGWGLPSGYSIVDPYLFAIWRWGPMVGLDTAPYPAWCGLAARVAERPAVARLMARLGIA